MLVIGAVRESGMIIGDSRRGKLRVNVGLWGAPFRKIAKVSDKIAPYLILYIYSDGNVDILI